MLTAFLLKGYHVWVINYLWVLNGVNIFSDHVWVMNYVPVCTGIKAKNGKGDCQSDKSSVMMTSSTMMTTPTDNQPSDERPGHCTSPLYLAEVTPQWCNWTRTTCMQSPEGWYKACCGVKWAWRHWQGAAERPYLGQHRIGLHLIIMLA